MAEQLLKDGERVDDLQLNKLKIIQNPARFCFGTDAVLLANFATAYKDERVIDLCTGTGIIPLLMSAKTQARHFTGLELQPESACMARRSVLLNNLSERIKIDTGDIKDAALRYGSAVFYAVTVNPPYLNAGIVNEREHIALARHEIACTLDDVLRVSAKLLRFGGRLYMVHRPHRLADVMAGLREHRLEPKRLRTVQPREGKDATLVLIEAALGGKVWLTVMPALDLSKDDGVMKGF
jgi:tRNA1Val (adenine37-N6)-methyltransferase